MAGLPAVTRHAHNPLSGAPVLSPASRLLQEVSFANTGALVHPALPAAFFERPAPEVAHDLLGRHLVRRLPDGSLRRARIVETEAYEGREDRASHASRGRTPRNDVMFGPPGHFYVYFIYGMHHMLNVVTNRVGEPSAVLIRGLENVRGPGRLTRTLGITRENFNTLAATPASGLWFEAGDGTVEGEILVTPRIGVDYAGPEWAAMPWRYFWRQRGSG